MPSRTIGNRRCGHAFVVPAERPEAAGGGRVGDDVDEIAAVAKALVELVGRQEARPRVARLRPEDPVELAWVAAALMDLHVQLRRVEDDREATRRALRRAQQCDGLARERLRVGGEVEATDVLEAGRFERPAVAVRVAPSLMLVALDGVGLDARSDVGERLLGVAAVGRGERLPLAPGVIAGLGERDALRPCRRAIRREEDPDLLLERHRERVLQDRRLVCAVGGRPIVEPDAVTQRGRRRTGDPDRLARDPIRLRRGHAAGAREAPGAVDEDAKPKSLGLARCDALDPPGLDRDPLLAPADQPHVRIGGPELGGGVEGSVGLVAHGAGIVAEHSRRAVRASSLSEPATLVVGRPCDQKTGRPPTACAVR